VKILQVNTAHHHGGAETVARQLQAGCVRAGHESTLLVAHGGTSARGAGVAPMYPAVLSRLHSSRFHSVTERVFPHDAWTDRVVARLADSDWDVIHVHNFHGDYARIETLSTLARRKPVVWTFHGCWGVTGGCDHTAGCDRYLRECGDCPAVGRWYRLDTDNTREELQRKIAAFGDAPFQIVAPSRWLAQTIRRSRVGSRWDVHVIPNGVDTRAFPYARKHDATFRQSLGIDPSATVALLTNRNFKDATKGFELARAALVTARSSGVHVVLAGLHSEWAAAQLEGVPATALGFVDSRERLARYYEAADVFLSSSPEENFSCAILEAMSAGCCVVSTPTAGAREQIDDGVSGVLAAGNSAEGLAQALTRVLGDTALRQQCGAAASARARDDFSESRMLAAYVDLYRGLTCN
jgi:glycosyltransferase involved in cell wall biosynthesis